ncbi:MAG: tRNA 2-thiouridine(34) synthase MnmA, partial [Cyclobacteriaceae bacterium]|nr:tRNA 2-thiouridine(34) synthase MnmA [Cyclobacteriaceae bacterium]
DSSVSAWLLQQQGYEVIGVFMRNWKDDSVIINDECPWIDDSNDAMLVAQKLGIPFKVIDLSEPYKNRIVDYMFSEYEQGRTPNPDILCNREIKFDVFLEAAMKLKADYVATGHYCRKSESLKEGQTHYHLLAGKDKNKDQSYFLCQLNQFQLSKALFPIGELEKPEVRDIARKLDLITAEKKDSQGLCFVGKVHLPEFLQQQLKTKKGNVILIEADSPLYQVHNGEGLSTKSTKSLSAITYKETDGRVIGEHTGAHYYTNGQRKGLNIGGFPKPLFVIGTNTVDNLIYMGMGEDHPGLYRDGLFVKEEDVHFLDPVNALSPGESKKYLGRIRYRQNLQNCTIEKTEKGLYVIFDTLQKAITAGQFVAWYEGDELIGSGVIS